MAHVMLGIGDGNYTISNLFSPLDGLAPKEKSVSEDNAVVAIAPSITDTYFSWKFVRHGVTLDKKALLATFELLDAGNAGTGFYLSYDYKTSAVVIKKDSRPVWAVFQHSGGITQFIVRLQEDHKFITFAKKGGQVVVNMAFDDEVLSKQVWNFQLVRPA